MVKVNLSSILMDPGEAESKITEYESVKAARRSWFDYALLRAYRAVASGTAILRLYNTVEAGGHFDNGLPRLAIVRADASECYIERHRGNPMVWLYATNREVARRWRGAAIGKETVAVPCVQDWPQGQWSGRTLAPIIPPSCRPARGPLSNFHLLWEVEEWKMTPPVDPALIRHLVGDLWVVHATWDLTPLEQAVMAHGSLR